MFLSFFEAWWTLFALRNQRKKYIFHGSPYNRRPTNFFQIMFVFKVVMWLPLNYISPKCWRWWSMAANTLKHFKISLRKKKTFLITSKKSISSLVDFFLVRVWWFWRQDSEKNDIQSKFIFAFFVSFFFSSTFNEIFGLLVSVNAKKRSQPTIRSLVKFPSKNLNITFCLKKCSMEFFCVCICCISRC